MGDIFGTLFRITTWGESHGSHIGVTVEGCPPRIKIDLAQIQAELDRRKPGQSKLTTQRKEDDTVQVLSGVYEGKTLGTPITLIIRNKDARPSAYDEMRTAYRPSHADYTYQSKYGHRNPEGGGRSSARETATRVAAGAIAKQILRESENIQISAYVSQVKDICLETNSPLHNSNAIEESSVRCPHPEVAEKMTACIESARKNGDSVGGCITCHIQGTPPGLGSPVFDRLEADLAKAMLSIPASKGFEIGSGFQGTQLFGSEHNDLFEIKGNKTGTKTNRSGGIQGGISNGEPIYFRVAFKPTATILKKQKTVNEVGETIELAGKGRHDPCVLPRAVPIVEAMTALTLLDHLLRHKAQCESLRLNKHE